MISLVVLAIVVALGVVVTRTGSWEWAGLILLAVVVGLVATVAGWFYDTQFRWYDFDVTEIRGNGDPASTEVSATTGCYRNSRLRSVQESPTEITIRVQRQGVSLGDCGASAVLIELEAATADRVLIDGTSGNRFRGSYGPPTNDVSSGFVRFDHRWRHDNYFRQP